MSNLDEKFEIEWIMFDIVAVSLFYDSYDMFDWKSNMNDSNAQNSCKEIVFWLV